MVVWKFQKITFKICLINIFTKCDQMPMRSSLLYLIGVLVALWFQLKDVQGVRFHKIDYWDQDNAISHWCARITFYQSSYTSDSTGHISGCLKMYIWSLARLYISWLWCQVHKHESHFSPKSQVLVTLSSKWSKLGEWWQISMSNTWGASGYRGLAGQCEAAVCETIAFQLSYIDLNKNGR